MDLSGYVDRLRAELVAAATTGGEAAGEALQRLTGAFDAAIRMTLLEALADAAAEISAELPEGAVDLRLKGREPHFVVSPPAPSADDHGGGDDGDSGADAVDEQATARLTLRLPEPLKQRVDEAAGRARLSTNTWLVEVIRHSVAAPDVRRRGRGRHLSGWAH